MGPGWRERRLYPLLGIISVLSLLYLNFGDHLSFPLTLWGQPAMSFVGTNSTRFVLLLNKKDQSTIYINGWNSYWLMTASMWVGPSRSRVSEMLKRGAQMGMTVCRTWAFSDGDGPNALQISPGVFNERVFRGLDYVIVEARRHRIRLILSLVNNLNAFGGKAQYVRWAQEAGVNISAMADPFFLHPLIKDYYKAYVNTLETKVSNCRFIRLSPWLNIHPSHRWMPEKLGSSYQKWMIRLNINMLPLHSVPQAERKQGSVDYSSSGEYSLD